MEAKFLLENIIVPKPQYRYFSITRSDSDSLARPINLSDCDGKSTTSKFYKGLEGHKKHQRKYQPSTPSKDQLGVHRANSGFSINSTFGQQKNKASSSTTAETHLEAQRRFQLKVGGKFLGKADKLKKEAKHDALPFKNLKNIIRVLNDRKTRRKEAYNLGHSACKETQYLRKRNLNLTDESHEVITKFQRTLKKMKFKMCENLIQ